MAITPAEITLSKLRERIKETGENSFRLQIARKLPHHPLSQRICTLDGATLEMIASPETWLPKLFGGGLFIITAMHRDALTESIGEPLTFQIDGDARNADPIILDIIKNDDWMGPKTLVYPAPKELEGRRQAHIQAISAPLGESREGIPSRTTVVPAQNPQVAFDPRYEAAARSLEDEKRAWEQKRREMDDAQRKLELHQQKAEADLRIAKLEAKLEAGAIHSAPKGIDITALIGALAPVLAKLSESQTELRKEMMLAEARARDEQMKLVTLMLEKKEDNSPNLKIMSTLAESFQSMNTMQMDMFHRMREAAFGPEEPVGLTVAKELGKAIVALGSSGLKIKAPPAQPQKQLPSQEQAPKQAPKAQNKAKADPVGRLEAMIRANMDPNIVADALFASLQEPVMQTELQRVAGDYRQLLQERLGVDWIGENMGYLQSLVATITEKGRELGFFANEENDTEPNSDETTIEENDNTSEEV